MPPARPSDSPIEPQKISSTTFDNSSLKNGADQLLQKPIVFYNQQTHLNTHKKPPSDNILSLSGA
jgi:hypothetical protein